MKFEIDGLDEFMKAIKEAADGGIRDKIELWLEAMGMEFLDIVQDEIIRTETVDTRRLLNSFEKGANGRAWSISNGGLTLEVGTNVHYASYVNDGHNTVDPSSGKDSRWVPGRWSGDRFIYEPGSDEGMLLIQKWVDGTNYFDNALAIFGKIFDRSLDEKLQDWMDADF